MNMKIEVVDNDDNIIEIILPITKEVCSRCNGTGRHTNPNIDGNGLSREDFEDDPDFANDYFSGVYDVVCEVCHGQNVVDVINRPAANQEHLQWYDNYKQSEWELLAMEVAERRFGA